MSLNTIAYIIYLVIITYIIFWLGKQFHSKGSVFILSLYNGDAAATDAINNILLIAYYLFNLGYAFLKLQQWETVYNFQELIASIGVNIGTLLLILSTTHYFNMFLIYILSKRTKTSTNL